jgi:uncharacterized protein YdeI (YjbR/CyaY-like superfamily)
VDVNQMALEITYIEVTSRNDWRKWLQKNHASTSGVWLVFFKDHTGVKTLSYQESLDEALCFGWIDSLIKRIDENRYARKFTPRKPTSKWSDINRKRWAELNAAGALAPPGLAAAPTDNRYDPLPRVSKLPPYIAKALKANSEAWRFFQELPPSHRHQYVSWIHTAKLPATRDRRIKETIRLLESGRKLGLK